MKADAAEAMDRMYRWQRHIYDFTRKPYLLGRDHLIERLSPPQGGSILEVGCGTARNLICSAQLYPDAKLYGIDVSSAMIETARQNVRRSRLMERIALQQVDAVDLASVFPISKFDRVFVSYALSMISDWRGVLASSFRLVAPGGALHVVDFGDFGSLPGSFRITLALWLRMFHVTPREDLAAEMSRLAAAEPGAKVEFERLRGGYAFYGSFSKPAALAQVDASAFADRAETYQNGNSLALL
jgi:S-adenosylmethionine-diacylgycerolhomoserine-N-methlytransferase